MTHTKTVTIWCNDLGKSVTWMFCFLDPPNPKIFKEYYPLAWKVVTIPATGKQYLSLTYTSELVVTKAQINQDNLSITAGAWQRIDPGFKTVLEGDDEVGYKFTTPVSFSGDDAVAINGTEAVQPMGVGFANLKGKPEAVLYFKSIAVQDQVVAKFTAVLNGYTTTDYKEKQPLKASIQDTAIRWTIDMMDASAPTDYDMRYHSDTGVFEIVASENHKFEV